MQYGLGVNKYEEVNQVSNIKRKTWMKTSIVKLGNNSNSRNFTWKSKFIIKSIR